MVPLAQRERTAVEVRQRQVGGEAQRLREALVVDVMGTLDAGRFLLRPAEPGVATDPDARQAIEGFDDAHQDGRAKATVGHEEPRREVDDTKRPGGRPKCGFEDIGIEEITLRPQLVAVGAYREFTALFAVEQ